MGPGLNFYAFYRVCTHLDGLFIDGGETERGSLCVGRSPGTAALNAAGCRSSPKIVRILLAG